MAFFSAKHLGAGQYYLMTIRDKDRKPLDGSGTYRLNVPANAPVKLYWSATVYDRATHALIRARALVEPLLQHARPQKNTDGSVDVCFGPKAPDGKETTGCRPTRRQVRSAVPPLRPGEAVLRQDVGAAGHRDGSLLS